MSRLDVIRGSSDTLSLVRYRIDASQTGESVERVSASSDFRFWYWVGAFCFLFSDINYGITNALTFAAHEITELLQLII